MDKAAATAVTLAMIFWFVLFGAATGLYNVVSLIKTAIQWTRRTHNRV